MSEILILTPEDMIILFIISFCPLDLLLPTLTLPDSF